jgi:hypothetical protein
MAAGQTQVLRELGGNWLQCQDAQGIFFYNSLTQQSSVDPPPELVQQPKQQTAPQVEVLRELGGGWMQCRDAQGIFFFNQVTQQSSVDVPAELRAPSQQPAPAPVAQPQPAMYSQQVQMPQVAIAGQTNVKEQVGEWLICEDAQGEYYHNSRTSQSFDQPPAELVQLYKMAQQQKQQKLVAEKAAAQQVAALQQQQQQAQLLQQQKARLSQQQSYGLQMGQVSVSQNFGFPSQYSQYR